MPPQTRSFVVRTLGIDLASQPTNTAACLIEWGDSTRPPRVHPPLKGLDDDALIALSEDVDAIGIDAPFGWPDAFVELVTAHRRGADRGRDWHDDDVRRALRLRLTDRWLWRESGLGLRPPLSVSSDLIALPAMRCAGLLGRLGVTDRAGDGRVFETWPAAAMHTWTGVSTGYKGRGAAAAVRREELRQDLETRLGLTIPPDAAQDDDRLDAVVAAVLARSAVLGHTMRPSPEQRAVATREGWIHATGLRPDDDRLVFLRHHESSTSEHAGHPLLEQPTNTRQLLADWGNRVDVCDAGLFHSVYGTESFLPPDLRPQVVELIGTDAERVAWLFGRRTDASFAANEGRHERFTLEDRFTGETLALAEADWRALCEVFTAHALAQKAGVDSVPARDLTQRFLWLERWTSPQAAKALRA